MVKLSHIYSIIFILLVYGFSYSDTHYVSLNGTNDADGKYTNWVGAATQIQWAVDAATNGETVLVSNGTYYCSGITTCVLGGVTNAAMIVITNSITLKSFSGSYVMPQSRGYLGDVCIVMALKKRAAFRSKNFRLFQPICSVAALAHTRV